MPLTPPSTAATPETAFKRLVTIMDDLRLNCPWDKKQTLESLRHLTIEETYYAAPGFLCKDSFRN
jgi:XTP/dITP diphosphohydrolase